ncbi:MAG: hypothetical protein KDD53_00275, partial [Bdellovibrionales bacterium]|nr:hypothetical protein [Bdellovibrionales bacterium]
PRKVFEVRRSCWSIHRLDSANKQGIGTVHRGSLANQKKPGLQIVADPGIYEGAKGQTLLM